MVTEYTSHEETVLIIALRYQNFGTTTLLTQYLHFVFHVGREVASQRLQCTDGIEEGLNETV